MKKITLLFATLLAMSGMAFGQKEGKVLWENVVDTIATGAIVNDVGGPILSPSGNILIQYNWYINGDTKKAGVKTYDNNGKLLWNATDFYRNPFDRISADIRNRTYTLINSEYSSTRGNIIVYDSTLYFDKNFKFSRRFFVNNPSAFLSNVEDGIFYNDVFEKKLIKYDAAGKEEWRYDTPDPIAILSQRPPYFGIPFSAPLNNRLILIFDKNGKKIGATEPFYFGRLIPTNDKGFWAQNGAYEYIKFDSTGKQTAKFSDSKGVFIDFSDTTLVLRDNSLLLSFIKDTEVSLVKISASGDIKRFSIPANIKFKDYYNTFIYKAIASENKIMYSLRLQDTEQAEADIKYKIGVVDFDNSANSWTKDIRGGASNGLYGNAFTFEAGNTFFQVYSKSDNPPIKTFKIYDINGNFKWESPFVINSPAQNIAGWRVVDSFLFTKALYTNGIEKEGLVKVSCTDGKIVWKKEQISLYNYQKDIQKDKSGNEVILYNKDGNYKIGILNSDGSDKWIYALGKSSNYFYSESINFTPTDDGNLVVFSQETKDNKQQYILRKIAPCTDITANATASNTEACPTEKVKLSIPKQDGLTYQWQKDGKDLPNLTDAVYDIGESGTYTVVVKDEACQSQVTSNALKINIRSLPTAEITAPRTTFCDGDKTTITAQTNGTFFQWRKDEKDIPNATSGILEVSQAGDYRVGVRDDKCPQVGLSNIIPITIKPSPEAKITTDIKTVIFEPFTVKMTANTGTGLSYQWLKDDVIIPNETTNIYEAKKSGKYNVTVTKDGCLKTSEALNISIQIALSTESEIGEETVKIYPNPSRGEFKLILPKSLQNAEIQLFDLLGRERNLTYTGEQAQADGLVQGTYFLKVTKGERSVTNKIVVE
ncbi:MAG: T9SS type A sorting domain-containing protein [Arcicella sp.]|nr:T9SS type A sorting domain-containing protein [Arcicella sp.]